MTPRTQFLALAVLALSATTSAASPPTVAAAGITLSNRLTPKKDARVIITTVIPRAGWVAPYQYTVTLDTKLRQQVRSTALRLVDTVDVVTASASSCVPYRVTVRPVGARDSLTRVTSYCRALSAYERAVLDSFPESTWRVALCGAREDEATVGTATRVVLLATNRYTGASRALKGGGAGCPSR